MRPDEYLRIARLCDIQDIILESLFGWDRTACHRDILLRLGPIDLFGHSGRICRSDPHTSRPAAASDREGTDQFRPVRRRGPTDRGRRGWSTWRVQVKIV